MPVTRIPDGTPMPDNHPLKGARIVFGAKRPNSPEQNAKEAAEQEARRQEQDELNMQIEQDIREGMLRQVGLDPTGKPLSPNSDESE